MNNFYREHLKKDIIEKIKLQKNVSFVRANTGKRWHILIDNELLFCKTAFMYNMVHVCYDYDDIINTICEECILNIRYKILNNRNKYRIDTFYCNWRCSQNIKNKICKNNSKKPNSYCKQHEKCIKKILMNKTTFPENIICMIYNRLG